MTTTTHKTLLALALVSLAMIAEAQQGAQRTKYWIGGAGEWTDAMQWSAVPNGAGGAGVPRANEFVVIAPASESTVHVNGRVQCAGLDVNASNAFVHISGSREAEITVAGDWLMKGSVHWDLDGKLRLTGGGRVDTRGIPLDGALIFDSEGDRTIESDLKLNAGDITFRKGTVHATGIVSATTLCSEGRAAKRFNAGRSVVMLNSSPDLVALGNLVNAQSSVLAIGGEQRTWPTTGSGPVDALDVNVCATGAGQTPFIATTSALTNYNGFNIRCRGDCNATITVNVTGGSGNFTYSWLFGGPATQTWVGACGGPQIVVVTDVTQGVSCGVPWNVTEPAPLGVIFFGQGTAPTCADICNGSRTALAIGGVPSYTYNWNNTGASGNSSFSQLCAGINTLQIADANLCTFDTTFTFNLLPISPNLVFADNSCFGQCDGTASVNPSGGTPNYVITWTPAPGGGQGTTNATGLCAGNYTVLIVDANGCDTTVAFTIAQPPPIQPNPTTVDASCFGACDGTASVAPAGSPGPFTYVWTPAPGGGGGTANATGLCAGNYTVLITDQITGCDTLVPITIDSPAPIVVQGTVTDATCANSCDGAIDIVINGGQAPLIITWVPNPSTGQGTTSISGLCAGPWSVTVVDALGCDTTVIFTVNAPPPIVASVITTDVTCAGDCDGTATADVQGGVPPYTYVWSPAPSGGQGTPSVSGLCAGPGSVLITDANGCDTTITFNINEPPPLVVTPSQTDVTCGSLCDGTTTVLVTGGVLPYTYLWTPAPPTGQGTPTASDLCAGPISVLITDANGCTITQDFVILDAVPILISLQVIPASCPGVCDGSAGVIVSGGVPAYTYVWAPNPGTGQGTPNATGLCPQAYTLTITDAVGCDTTIAFAVPAPPPINASGVITDATCNGDCDGAITLTVSGGNGTFTYAWTNNPPVGQGTGSVSALCAGTYDVIITSGACDTTLTFTVNEPPPIDASVTTTDPTCAGACDGTATVAASGGTAPLTYVWSPNVAGQGTPNATAICPGNYTVQVIDAAGCDTTIAFVVNDPIPILVDLVITPASCGGGCDGTATATPSGGTGPYTYDWQTAPGSGQGTPNAIEYCPGAYTLTVTDAVGCSVVVPFAISTPSGIDAQGTVTDASCVNNCDGAIDVIATGGLPALIYTWTPNPGAGQGTPNASGLCPGLWSLQISDAAQCDTVLLFTVGAPAAIVPNETHTDENCFGPCNGTATVNPTGNGPFSYIWSPLPPNGQQGQPSVNSLCPGIWTVVIGDASGCDTTVVFDILPKVPISDNLVWTDSPCPNTCDGTASVSPTGGIPPYTYLWTPTPPVGQGTASVSGLCLGVWQVRAFDSVGCFSSTDFFVGTPPQFDAALVITPETCAGTCTGTATITPTGGTGTISIDWQPPVAGQGTTTATGLCAGTNYTVTLTDDNGCDSTFAFTVDPFTAILANSSSTPVSCSGACDATATVGPTGGIAPYTYDWQPPPFGGQGTPQATGLCEGVISVTITDASGCSIVANILITGPSPIVDNAVINGIGCAGDCNGSITLAPSGGVAPYIITWNPIPPNGQGGNNATGLCAGTYAVNITDASGCSVDFTYDLTQPQPIVLDITTTQSQCAVCIGAADLVITGGVGPYSITWLDPSAAVIATDVLSVANLCGGIHTVVVTDANGCSAQMAVPITDSNGEVLTVTDGTTSCPNTCDGSVSVAFTCSDPPCTISWTDAQGNDLGMSGNGLSGLCPGDYLVQVINGSGCITIDTATVISPSPTTLLISSSPETCFGACDGTAAVGVNGGVAPYTFIWSPPPGGGQGTPLATGLCVGVYTVLIGDAAGCDTTAQVLITGPDVLTSGAVLIDISCNGQCDGNITLGIGGGTAPYTIVWSPIPPNGQGVTAAFALCAGDWTAAITDANGCTLTETYTINEPLPLDVSVSTVASTCPNCDGTATATISGGTAPYDVDWSLNGITVSTDPNAIDLCGGLYTLTVSDANGCSVQQVVQVSDSNAEVLTPTNGLSTCANNCDGVVSVSFICNAPPCNVNWTDAGGNTIAQNVLSVDSLCIGTYTAEVTNANGCVSFADASVLPSQVIIANLSTTPVTCSGDCDGTATVGPTGGVQPYTYVWAPPPGGGQNTPQATGLCEGIYTVTIADANFCDTVIQVLITGPLPLTLDGIVQNISCDQLCDGSITVVVNGGTGSYIYAWSPAPTTGQGTNTASDLCAGDYTLTVTDANGCVAAQTWTVIEPQPLQVNVGSTQSECGLCNGTAGVVVGGGTAPYFITWSIGGNIVGTGDTLTALCAGIYNVLITDANLCTLSAIAVVSDVDGEVLAITNDLVTCPGDCDGVVSVAYTCSDPPCTSAWFDAAGNDLNEPGNTLGNLCAGLYFIQVTNGTGCITIDTAFVAEPDPIVPNLSTSSASCFGMCDGTATVGPTGGQPTYTYVWSPMPPIGQGTAQADSLCAGTWTVVISDLAGCSITVDVLILEPTPVTATSTVTPITCNGACDGTINVVPSGGTAPYAYAWVPLPFNGDGTPDAINLCAGDWSVTITDFNGCDTTYTFTLTDPPVLDAQVSTADNICYGDCNGTAQVTITGGIAPYTIAWLDAGGASIAIDVYNITSLCAGAYSVVITDANGCTLAIPFTIAEGTPIVANLTFTNETCFGPCDGTAAVSPTGGIGPYTYFWQPAPTGTGQGTAQVTGLCAGLNSVTITDALLCDTVITFTVDPYTPINDNETVSNVQCHGACDGSIVTAATGGIGSLNYVWTPPPPNGQGNAQATGLCPGSYSLTITDGVGCGSTFNYIITEPDTLNVTVDLVVDASCADAADGEINITVSGGTPNYASSWTGPNNFTAVVEDISGLVPGSYTFTVTDANGCTFTIGTTVNALVTVIADAGVDQTECTGVPIVLDGSASTGAVNFEWRDPQNNVIANSAIADPGTLPPGTYTFTLIVSDGPCSDSDEITIVILDLPIANAGPDVDIFLGDETTLGGSPTGPPGSTFLWTPDSLVSNATIANPITEPPVTTWFTVLVTSPNGCQSLDSILVTVIPEIVIPTGVTPNGDGWNDTWVIDHIDLFPECEVEVYNRWGDMLFRSVGYKEPWEGKYNGGYVPVGTYYYVIKLNDPRFPDAYTGPLTVIR